MQLLEIRFKLKTNSRVKKKLGKGKSLNDNIYPCNCESLYFCDPEHGHIIAGDLRLVKHQILKKFFTKGLHFRDNDVFFCICVLPMSRDLLKYF